jgi:hypothetical protein
MPSTTLKEFGMVLPTSSTASRPTAAAGMVRHNSSTGTIEYYNGTTWLTNPIYSATAPTSPTPYDGMLWYDTTNKATKHYDSASAAWVSLPNVPLDGSTQARAASYGSDIIALKGASFTAGLYWLTGAPGSLQTAQRVYVDTDGWMLYYRHAGTGGSFNGTYEILGDTLGEGAIGTLNSPTQGLTDSGSSTTSGSRGVARLSTEFVRALGGNSASGNVYRHVTGGNTCFLTDTYSWYTRATADGYPQTSSPTISGGSSYSGRRNTSFVPDVDRPLCGYQQFTNIPFYHGSAYSGGYDGTWHVACTMWVRQY